MEEDFPDTDPWINIKVYEKSNTTYEVWVEREHLSGKVSQDMYDQFNSLSVALFIAKGLIGLPTLDLQSITSNDNKPI